MCRHVPDLEQAIRGHLVLLDGTDVSTGNRAGHPDNFSGKRHRAGPNIQAAGDTGGGLLGIREKPKGGELSHNDMSNIPNRHRARILPAWLATPS